MLLALVLCASYALQCAWRHGTQLPGKKVAYLLHALHCWTLWFATSVSMGDTPVTSADQYDEHYLMIIASGLDGFHL